MERYHQDVLKFIQQPPDHYEMLRARLPKDNQDALFHMIEAELVTTVVGDLNLIPPILRKYWDQFLQPGPFHSWHEAMAWYQALPREDKAIFDKYTGLGHFDLRQYSSIKYSSPSRLSPYVKEILLREDKQRLWDLADQFDLLVGAPELGEDFHFWRRYLREIVDLHKLNPEYLPSLDLPQAAKIAKALDFLKNLEGVKPEQKASLVLQEFSAQPFLAHFLPTLDNRTLVEMFTSGAKLPEGATLKGTAGFVELLKNITLHVDKILELGRKNVEIGAAELQQFLAEVDFGKEVRLDYFFEILRDSDDSTAMKVATALDDATLRRLFMLTEQGYLPARMRALLEPLRLLQILDITPNSPEGRLAEGIEDFIEYPAGNFRIDEPFFDVMYPIIATRGASNPEEMLRVIRRSPFPMERFIMNYPLPAVQMLASDLDTTLELVKTSDSMRFPPVRFIYRLIYANPEFAARVVARLDEHGGDDLVVEALAHFAYDADRLQAVPSLPISLERDGRFLKRLLKDKGAEWLAGRLEEVVRLYRQHVEGDEIPRDFLPAYERTLRAAGSQVDNQEAGRTLEEIIGRVFGPG